MEVVECVSYDEEQRMSDTSIIHTRSALLPDLDQVSLEVSERDQEISGVTRFFKSAVLIRSSTSQNSKIPVLRGFQLH
jgi:hypothetical protein